MRCLLPGEKVWKDDCPTRATTQQGEFSTLTKEELETNPFGYYGQINANGISCIRDVTQQQSEKRHKRTGKVCGTWKNRI